MLDPGRLREAPWGSGKGVGGGDLSRATVQLQVLVPCLEICSGHKELHEDTGAKATRAAVGDGELKEGGL